MRWSSYTYEPPQKEKSTPKGATFVKLQVHTAEAVYCQLGDIGRDLERPSKLDESINPSGKLVGEFAAKGEKPP